MRKILLIPIAFTLTLSACDDFFNKSKNARSLGGDDKNKPAGQNPFPPGFDFTSPPFTEAKMLANIGVKVIAPATAKLRLQLEVLGLELQSLRERLANERHADTSAVESAWRSAMMSYHFLAAAAVGPMTDNRRQIADNLYGWPSFNPCGIDMEVESLARTGVMNERILFTAKGLAALEYLIFEPTLGTQCNPLNPRYKPAHEWARKDARQKRADRIHYASEIVKDAVHYARELEQAWDPEGANFSNTLINRTRYPDLHKAINALSDALFAFEEVKDRRLGRPIGLHPDCTDDSGKCVTDIEHRWSGVSIEAMQARMRGFAAVFMGADFGLDDLLISQNKASVSQAIEQALNQVLNAVNELRSLGTLENQIKDMDVAACRASTSENRLVPVCALHADLKRLSQVMKIDFLAALSLTAPPSYQGDND